SVRTIPLERISGVLTSTPRIRSSGIVRTERLISDRVISSRSSTTPYRNVAQRITEKITEPMTPTAAQTKDCAENPPTNSTPISGRKSEGNTRTGLISSTLGLRRDGGTQTVGGAGGTGPSGCPPGRPSASPK